MSRGGSDVDLRTGSTPPTRGRDEEGTPERANGTPDGQQTFLAPGALSQRLRHGLSLVATLPAVRRIRNFLNPNSRLPDSTSPMVLLGVRYERAQPRTRATEDGGAASEGSTEDEAKEWPRRAAGPSVGPKVEERNDAATIEGAPGVPDGRVEEPDGGSPPRADTRAGAAAAAAAAAAAVEWGAAALRQWRQSEPHAGTLSSSPQRQPSDAFGPASFQTAPVPGNDEGLRGFVDDFQSRVWMTYRRGFPNIGTSPYTTDAGWGCTVRSAQMLLANGLSIHFFGRQWRWDGAYSAPSTTPGTVKDAGTLWSGLGRRGSSGDLRRSGMGGNNGDGTVFPLTAAHSRLVSWFGDDASEETCPFSIHSIITSWGKDHGLAAGTWLGPCVLARGLAALVSKHRPGGLTAFVVAGEDGGFGGGAPTLYRSSVYKLAREEARSIEAMEEKMSAARGRERRRMRAREGRSVDVDGRGDQKESEEDGEQGGEESGDTTGNEDSGASHPLDIPGAPFSRSRHRSGGGSGGSGSDGSSAGGDWTPMIILVPLVLGLGKTINPRYLQSLIAMLSLPQTLGILGGRPAASLYFVGAQDDNLFYLDPHTVQSAVPLAPPSGVGGRDATNGREEGRGFGFFPTETYHCATVLHLNGRELDPSMALGFYCRTKSDFDSLYIELELLSRKAGSPPLLTVADGPPPPSPCKNAPKKSGSDAGVPGAKSPRLSDASAAVSDASEPDSEDGGEWEML